MSEAQAKTAPAIPKAATRPTKAKDVPPAPVPAAAAPEPIKVPMYKNCTGTTIFVAAGRCHRDTVTALTPAEVAHWGDKVRQV